MGTLKLGADLNHQFNCVAVYIVQPAAGRKDLAGPVGLEIPGRVWREISGSVERALGTGTGRLFTLELMRAGFVCTC